MARGLQIEPANDDAFPVGGESGNREGTPGHCALWDSPESATAPIPRTQPGIISPPRAEVSRRRMNSSGRARSGSALSRYLSDIRSFPLLSKEEEIEIGEKISEGRSRGLDELVLSNLGFVVKIATEYQNMGLPFEDLLNEGNIGLIHAASRYDHRKGIKFITYASWWVRKSILKALSDQSSMIRVPSYQRKKVARLRAETEAQRAQHGHPTGEPGCPDCDPLPQGPRFRAISLDDLTRADGHARMIEILIDDSSEDPEFEIIRRESLQRLSKSFTCLTEKERAVISHRFGLAGRRVSTLKEIGSELGLSRERVRQIEMSARKKLRAQLYKPRRPEAGRDERPAGRTRRATST